MGSGEFKIDVVSSQIVVCGLTDMKHHVRKLAFSVAWQNSDKLNFLAQPFPSKLPQDARTRLAFRAINVPLCLEGPNRDRTARGEMRSDMSPPGPTRNLPNRPSSPLGSRRARKLDDRRWTPLLGEVHGIISGRPAGSACLRTGPCNLPFDTPSARRRNCSDAKREGNTSEKKRVLERPPVVKN